MCRRSFFKNYKMRYVAAYLLAVLGSKTNPSSSDIEKILSSVGIESDAERVKTVLKQLEGKNVDEVIAEGLTKLASMPAGGGGGAAAPAAAAPAAGEAKKEEKKEEKKQESESEDDDMGFGLFD
ncbi:unnamed protein product [Allacma fusca]|uniref:Large ribosomal subunit protein P2 n=1 Tax=Allacma fusca TaxID=39272 RepID=A0A8J2KD39_9HEXA|nr:unnamed protein product [Allacma fusca]